MERGLKPAATYFLRSNTMKFQNKVFRATKKIPKGKVATYSQIAKIIGSPQAARAVGNALNKNCDPKVPCHRVVRSDGFVGGFRWGGKAKIKKLKSEGVVIIDGMVNLEKYGISFRHLNN